MYKILSLLLCITLSSVLCSQETLKEPYLNPGQIKGICDLGNLGAVLSYEGSRQRDAVDLYTLHYLDESVATQELTLPLGSSFLGAEANDRLAVLLFRFQEDILMVSVDPGADPAYSSIRAKANQKYASTVFTDLDNLGNLIVARYYYTYEGRKEIEQGLIFTTLDGRGNVLNERSESHEREFPFRIVGTFATSNGVAYHIESSYKSKNSYQSRITFCDNNGAVLGEYDLGIGEEQLYPSEIIYDNGKYVMVGDYLTGNVFNARKAEGLFMCLLNEMGQEQSYTFYDWDNLKETLKESKRSDFIFSGNMRVMVESVVNNGSGYSIVGESYYKGSGITAVEFFTGTQDENEFVISVLDFVLFDTDFNGNLTSVTLLEKEESNILMAGVSKNTRAVRMARLLKQYKVLPFRSVADGKITFVKYIAKQGVLAEMDIATGEVTEGASLALEITRETVADVDADELVASSGLLSSIANAQATLDETDAKLDAFGNTLEYGIEKVDRVWQRRGLSDRGLLFLTNGQILAYQIDAESHAVFYSYIK